MKLETLRSRLSHRFPEALPRPDLQTDVAPFGIPEVDALLSRGGLARGRLSEIVGAIGSGRTSLVRSLVRTAPGPVALVDTDGTLAPSDWVRDGVCTWIVRADGLFAADILLRSRSFGLVVVFGATGRRNSPVVRLQRLAEESAAVCVFVGESPQGSSLVTTRLAVTGGEFLTAGIPPVLAGRRVAVRLEKGGPHRTVEIVLHEEETDRLLAHPEAPDRALVAWRGAGGRKQAPRFARG